MENIKSLNAAELGRIIEGIVLAYDYNESINEGYQLDFTITDKREHFTVDYSWVKGVIKGTVGDPQFTKDDTLVVESNYFKIFKSESFRKLTKEVIDALSEVTANAFDAEMEN